MIAAIGFTILIMSLFRVWLDACGWAASDRAKCAWGTFGLTGAILIIVSIVIALWRNAP